MLLTVSIQMNLGAANVLSKSRVWENYKHGSVGAFIANELKINFMESLL